MPPTTVTTTSIDVKFYLPGSQTPLSVVDLSITDNRSKVIAHLNVLDQAKYSAVQCIVDSATKTSTTTMNIFTLHPGNTVIGTDQFGFEAGKAYSFKFVSINKENGELITSYGKCSFGPQTNAPSYKFDYIPYGSERFTSATITNASQLTLSSSINIHAPMLLIEKQPHSMVFNVDQEDSGVLPDDNSELIKYSSVQTYNEDNNYVINAAELGYGSYAVSVTAMFDDGHAVSTVLPEIIQILPELAVDNVSPYGLGDDGTDGGDPEIINVLDFSVNNAAIVIPQLLDQNIQILFKQGDVAFYKALIDASNNTPDTQANRLKYHVLKEHLISIYTDEPPQKRPDNRYVYTLVFSVIYKSNIVNIDMIKRSYSVPDDVVFGSDYTPIDSVTLMNAWNAASVTTVSGKNVIDLSDASSKSGYDAAPDAGIIGYFDKTPYFKTGITYGFQQDLDLLDTTKFKLTMSVKNGFGTTTTLPVKSARWISSDSLNLRANVLSLLNSTTVDKDDGIYENIEGGSRLYFLVERVVGDTFVYHPTDEVTVSVELITHSVLPPATSSNTHTVVTKPGKYVMAANNVTEPGFKDGTLTLPAYYALNGGLELIGVISNLSSPNDDIVVPSTGGTTNVTITPKSSERGEINMTFQVYYGVLDNDETVRGPLSDVNTISLFDPPTLDNFTVTDDSYTTINDEGLANVTFTVNFLDAATTDADGIKVYFRAPGQADLLVTRFAKKDGESQTKTLTLNDGSFSTRTANGILINGIGETDNIIYTSDVEWVNNTAAQIVAKPYYYERVLRTDDSFDQEIIADGVEHTFDINNVALISGALGFQLIGGVRESNESTRITWAPADDPSVTSYKVTVTKHEYSKKFSTVYKPDPASYPSATAPPETLSGINGFYYNRVTTGSKYTWYVQVPEGLKAGDIKNMQLDMHVVDKTPKQNDNDAALIGFYTAPQNDGKDKASWYRSRCIGTAHHLNRTYAGDLSFLFNVDPSSTSTNIHRLPGYEMLDHSLATNSLFATGSSVKDIGDETVSLIHVSSDSGGTRSEHCVQRLTMELQTGDIVLYQFSRTGEEDTITMTSTTTLPGTATEFVLDMDSSPLAETFTVGVEKIITYPNGDAFSAPITVIQFDPPSVDQTQVVTIINRGSKENILKASFGAPEVLDTTTTYQTLGVTLYNEANYGSYPNFAPLVLDQGDYDDNYFASKMFNDSIRSMKIPAGYTVTVYEHNFSGESATYNSNQASVLPSISSVKIMRNFEPVANSLVVSEVKLVDNPNTANEDPEALGVTPLTCTNNPFSIQSFGVTNTYEDALIIKGNRLNLCPRTRAAVRYTEILEGSTAQDRTSQPTYLKLAAPETPYKCAGKCHIEIVNHRIQEGGVYNGQLALDMCVNTNGMGDEGVQAIAMVIAQEGDFTDETDVTGGDGVQVAIGFSASDAVAQTYATQADASGSNGADRIRPGETVLLAVTDLDGFNEPAAADNWVLKSGDQTEFDVTTVYFPVDSGFNASKHMQVFATAVTRVSVDIAIKVTDGTI
jgi:hypothetical protein